MARVGGREVGMEFVLALALLGAIVLGLGRVAWAALKEPPPPRLAAPPDELGPEEREWLEREREGIRESEPTLWSTTPPSGLCLACGTPLGTDGIVRSEIGFVHDECLFEAKRQWRLHATGFPDITTYLSDETIDKHFGTPPRKPSGR